MNQRLIFILFLLMTACFTESSAQDSLKLEQDSAVVIRSHSPTIAGLASALLPGTGQVYNHKYWKVPILYAGLATAGYFIYFNGNVYTTAKKNLDSRVSGDSTPEPQFLIINNIFSKTTIDLNVYTDDEMLQLQDDYRRYFTISIIAGAGVYLLNILDAVVDAHLYHFDVSDNLSLDLQPELFHTSDYRAAPGFSVSFTLK